MQAANLKELLFGADTDICIKNCMWNWNYLQLNEEPSSLIGNETTNKILLLFNFKKTTQKETTTILGTTHEISNKKQKVQPVKLELLRKTNTPANCGM